MNRSLTLKFPARLGLLLVASFFISVIIYATPTITSVSPLTGIPNVTAVTITGSGFNDTAARNVVWFGNVRATVNSATATALNVTVPVGARNAPISVFNMTTRLASISETIFRPDYDNSCYIAGTLTFKPRIDLDISPVDVTDSDPYHAAIGDIDGDGYPDLVVSMYGSFAGGQSYLYIYRNTGTRGQLSFDAPVQVITVNGAASVHLADLDGDSKLDIIVAATGSGRVGCSRNKSTPGVISIAPVFYKTFSSGAPDIAIADFDGDGKLDIAGGIYTENKIEIFKNIISTIPTNAFTTNGTLSSYYVTLPTGNVPYSICAADIDGDHKPDIITNNVIDGNISVLRNTSVVDSFMFATSVQFGSGTDARLVRLQDINGDGKQDVVTANYGDTKFKIYPNTSAVGVVSFATQVEFNTGTAQPGAFDFGDFNGDGKTDIAFSYGNTSQVGIFYNNYTSGAITTSTFTAGPVLSTGVSTGPGGVTVGDIDGDTKPDIVVGNVGNNTVSIFKNTGTPDTVSIIGTDSVCVSSTITLTTLHCANEEAYWSSTNGHTSVTGGTGTGDINAAITGISAGTDTIVCTIVSLYDTNYMSYVVSVLPSADTGIITGPNNICVGATATLLETATGGTWSSSAPAIVTITATGVITALTTGSAVLLYTNTSASCGSLSAHHAITVNALPDAGNISGPDGVCTGNSITLTASIAGGTWINRYPAVATAAPLGTTNVITGATVGVDTILYVSTTALCGSDTAIKEIGVISTGSSLPITGPDSVCNGATISLDNAAGGGTWSSSAIGIATVNATTGVVTGSGVGTATITYSVTYTCGTVTTTRPITVNAVPNAGTITGADSVCSGAIITLTTTGTGGTWSSSSTGIATVTTGGVVGGASATLATATISYTASTLSCGSATSTHNVTVKPLPNAGAIVGLDSVCSGAVITLTNPTAGAGTWSSLSTAIATVNSSGVVGGVSASLATTTISYTASTFSCGSASATKAVTVKPLPNAGTITGADSVCNGAVISLTTTGTGGTWNSSSSSVATVTTGGVVGGASATLATATISYTASTFSCGSATATHDVTVKPLPNAGAIVGLDSVCSGAIITLTNPTAGAGTWSSLSTAIATINSSGGVGGVSASLATTTISYTASTFSCGSASATKAVTVKPLPNAGTITGADSVCNGAAITLTTTGTGGAWNSSATAVATVTSGGVVGGASATLATATISYTASTFSCGSATATHDVTVKPLPNAGAIVGLDSVCSGAIITLTNPTAGAGTWSSLSTAIATVNSSGVVGGVSASLATTTISYTASTFSCGSASATKAVTVKPLPNAGTITGPTSVCSGSTISLLESATGGTWSTGSAAIATVSGAGVIATVGGTSTTLSSTNITYTVSTFSCGTATATQAVTVNPLPDAGTIGGASTICQGVLTTLTETATGGTWSSTNTSAATVSTGGVVGGVAGGSTTISYTVTNTCGTVAATWPMTAVAQPVAGTISGPTSVCQSTTVVISSSAPGGTWSTDGSGIATISGTGSIATVGGAVAGLATVSYTVTNVCGSAFDTALMTVNPLPFAGVISGLSTVCEGSTITLSGVTAGGTWSSLSPTIATVNTSGVVGGASAGSTTIRYSYTNICGTDIATKPVTVNPLPHAGTISGVPNLCPGTTTSLTSTTAGGAWSISPVSVATIGGTGIVGGVSPGSATVTYTYVNVCGSDQSTYAVTVIPFPTAGTISGPSQVCPGNTISLTSTSPGGTWTSLAPLIATVGTATGVVGGVIAGNATIRYTVTNFCGSAFTTRPITVNPIVVPSVTFTYSPNDTICEGTLVTFTPTAVNGGPTPTFIWTNFGVPFDTVNVLTYAPQNADAISVVMISSAPCPVPPADTAAAVQFLVYPSVTPDVTIVSSVAGDVVSYIGQLVTFFTGSTFGGTNPTYQWYLNGVAVPGATSTSFSTIIETDDTVYCVMTSDLPCTTSPTDTSNIKIISIGNLAVDGFADAIEGISVYPNPNTGNFSVSGTVSTASSSPMIFQVIDMMGKVILTDQAMPLSGTFKHDISISDIAAGNYILRVVRGPDIKAIHFTINN